MLAMLCIVLGLVVVACVMLFAVGVYATYRQNVRDYSVWKVNNPNAKYPSGRLLFARFLGVYWAVGDRFGNCFSPAVVVETSNFGRLTFTIRTQWKETVVYFGGNHWIRWNSEHIAYRFGQSQEANFGTVYQYNGWMGNHLYL